MLPHDMHTLFEKAKSKQTYKYNCFFFFKSIMFFFFLFEILKIHPEMAQISVKYTDKRKKESWIQALLQYSLIL